MKGYLERILEREGYITVEAILSEVGEFNQRLTLFTELTGSLEQEKFGITSIVDFFKKIDIFIEKLNKEGSVELEDWLLVSLEHGNFSRDYLQLETDNARVRFLKNYKEFLISLRDEMQEMKDAERVIRNDLLKDRKIDDIIKDEKIHFVDKLFKEITNKDYKSYVGERTIIFFNCRMFNIEFIYNFEDVVNKILPLTIEDKKQYIKYFRGHTSLNYRLIPSVYRNKNIYQEDIRIRELMNRYPNDFINCNNSFEELILLQHYNIPTRLLDVTRNPLVGLYFACNSGEGEDGLLLELLYPKMPVGFSNSFEASFLSNVSKYYKWFNLLGHDELVNENNNEKFQHVINRIKIENSDLYSKFTPDYFNRTFIIEGPYNNERIRAQSGAFILFGFDKVKVKRASFAPGYRSRELDTRPVNNLYIIHKDAKANLLLYLDMYGINKMTLFPEIDKAGEYINEMY